MLLIFRGDVDPTRKSSFFEYKGYVFERDGEPIRVRPDIAQEILAISQLRFEEVQPRTRRPRPLR